MRAKSELKCGHLDKKIPTPSNSQIAVKLRLCLQTNWNYTVCE